MIVDDPTMGVTGLRRQFERHPRLYYPRFTVHRPKVSEDRARMVDSKS